MTDMDTVKSCCIKGIHHFDAPTAATIAKHYRLDEADVLNGMLALRRKRIVRDRRRNGLRVWGEWR